VLLGRKSSFAIEDVMHLIWPCASISNVRTMKSWCNTVQHVATDQQLVPAPPVLPGVDFDGLSSVFRQFDADGSGKVSVRELMKNELIYEEQANQLVRNFDRDKDGELNMLEFCELMCPAGFRAHKSSKVAFLSDGSRILLDENVDCWRTEDPGFKIDAGWL